MSEDKHWSEGLPAEMAAHGDVKGSDTLETFVKRYTDNRATMSRSILMPNAEAGDEERDKFYSKLEGVEGVARIPAADDVEGWKKLYPKLGVPESASGYEMENEELANTLHGLNLNSGQARRINELITEKTTSFADLNAEETLVGLDALKNEWGETFEGRAKLATKVLRDHGGDELMSMLEKSGLTNNADIIKLGYALNKTMVAKKLTRGENETATYGGSKDEINEKIASVMANQSDPFHIKSHPDHSRRVDTVLKYYEELDGG